MALSCRSTDTCREQGRQEAIGRSSTRKRPSINGDSTEKKAEIRPKEYAGESLDERNCLTVVGFSVFLIVGFSPRLPSMKATLVSGFTLGSYLSGGNFSPVL